MKASFELPFYESQIQIYSVMQTDCNILFVKACLSFADLNRLSSSAPIGPQVTTETLDLQVSVNICVILISEVIAKDISLLSADTHLHAFTHRECLSNLLCFLTWDCIVCQNGM